MRVCTLASLAVLGAAVELLAGKLNATMAGLQGKLQPALKAAGVIKADVLSSLLAPVQGTAGEMACNMDTAKALESWQAAFAGRAT